MQRFCLSANSGYWDGIAILKNNHADDQFLIRRKLKELPDSIERLTKRRDQLEQDIATIAANTFTQMQIGDRTVLQDQARTELGLKLATLPEQVGRLTQFPLGKLHGLTFGLTLLPHNQTSEVYLEGSLTRSTQLNRNHTGPRAILNALTRLESTYQEQLDKATEDLALCHKQQQDYQHRLGQPFPDNEYLKHLTELRDKLRAGLSDRAPTSADETPQVPVAELASQIKALRSSHTAEDIPDRRSEKPLSQAEVPISARIHRNSTILQSSSLINNNQPTR